MAKESILADKATITTSLSSVIVIRRAISVRPVLQKFLPIPHSSYIANFGT
jgi:hypothetical protein